MSNSQEPYQASGLMRGDPYLKRCHDVTAKGDRAFPKNDLSEADKEIVDKLMEVLYDPLLAVTLDTPALKANHLGISVYDLRRLQYCEYTRQRAIAYAQQLAAENLPPAVAAAAAMSTIPNPSVHQMPHVLKATSLLAQISGATTPQARIQKPQDDPGAGGNSLNLKLEVLVRQVAGQDAKPVIIDQEE